MTKTLLDDLKTRCISLVLGDQSPAEFEEWIYCTAALEDELGADNHLFFLGLDYHSPCLVDEITSWASRFFGSSFYSSEWETQKLKKQLEFALQLSFLGMVEKVSDLQCLQGYSFLADLGIVCYNDADVCNLRIAHPEPTDEKAYEEYFPGFREAIEQVIRWLENGRIIVLRENDPLDEPLFRMEDRRSESDNLQSSADRIDEALDKINRQYSQTLQRLA